MELVCPAGSLPAFKAAVEAGADAIYIGFKDNTNARHFAGLNFDDRKARQALDLARDKGVKLFVAINTYAQQREWHRWKAAVDQAVSIGANALIAADMSVMEYAHTQHPDLHLHLSVQGSATNFGALQFYVNQFNIKRAVLPRVLSLKQVKQVAAANVVDVEVFGFGSLCIMAEGRCYLSSYITGESPNTQGVCSPARFVEWRETGQHLESRLNNVVIDRYQPEEKAGYPTLCKGRFDVDGHRYHALEEPTSLNTLTILPELQAAGVKAVKIEGRQRSPAYVGQVVSVWRKALDKLKQSPENFRADNQWMEVLQSLSEGSQTTLGAYSRPWQ
ncbi:protease [Hahella sp. CCB-MM4]|uniref:ubiquinone anaerobic biosynthesis protein UbiU n=1 Tax=Hahella sp. (strain CCB-MM4) TaxID=1926491 RepID=UPI000B9C434B|nr:peptidase U32 family protein [Hahella sp. CCB-MM4]OZG72332.1 protease [Hahella sp. CCB-MM4]